MDHVSDTDLKDDFGIEVRLHRVKIIEGIKKLQNKGTNTNHRKTPSGAEQAQH